MTNVRDVPDPATLGFKAPKWQAALKEHHRLQRQRMDMLAEQAQLRTRLADAQQEDTYAHAAAIRASKPDPGTPATDAVKSIQASVERQVNALTVAVDQAERELLAAVESEKDTVLAEAEQAVGERRVTLQASVDAWAESRTRHSEAVALREYLAAFPNGRFKVATGHLRGQAQRGDGAPASTVDQIADALRRDAAEPQKRPQPEIVQPLLPRDTAFGVSPVLNLEKSGR